MSDHNRIDDKHLANAAKSFQPEGDRLVARAVKTSIWAAVLAVPLAVLSVLVYFHFTEHHTIHILNTTGKDGVSVFIDGDLAAQNLKNAATENGDLLVKEKISRGKHKLEAKDADGKVLESLDFEFPDAIVTREYLYAPAHDPNICFFVRQNSYGTPKPWEQIDKARTFWVMARRVDHWFKNYDGYVVRQAACDDPKFQY